MDGVQARIAVFSAISAASITLTSFGWVGSGRVSMMCRRDERRPGTTR